MLLPFNPPPVTHLAVNSSSQIRVPVPDERKEMKQEDVYFRKLLLNRCQREFETGTLTETDFENQRKELDNIENAEERAIKEEELSDKVGEGM